MSGFNDEVFTYSPLMWNNSVFQNGPFISLLPLCFCIYFFPSQKLLFLHCLDRFYSTHTHTKVSAHLFTFPRKAPLIITLLNWAKCTILLWLPTTTNTSFQCQVIAIADSSVCLSQQTKKFSKEEILALSASTFHVILTIYQLHLECKSSLTSHQFA